MISGKDVPDLNKFGVIRLVSIAILFASISLATKIYAASDASGVEPPPGWAVAKDTELDELRGGFMLDNGMVIDLSLATSVFINGEERFSDRFVLANDFSIDQLRGAVVNNGPNNLGLSGAGMSNMSLIQNTMDNQIITMMRSIDITISNIKSIDRNGF